MGGLADCKVFTPLIRSLTNNRNQLVVNGVPEYVSQYIYFANLKFSKTKPSLLPLYSRIQVAYS